MRRESIIPIAAAALLAAAMCLVLLRSGGDEPIAVQPETQAPADTGEPAGLQLHPVPAPSGLQAGEPDEANPAPAGEPAKPPKGRSVLGWGDDGSGEPPSAGDGDAGDSESWTLKGRVADENGEPLAGVRIEAWKGMLCEWLTSKDCSIVCTTASDHVGCFTISGDGGPVIFLRFLLDGREKALAEYIPPQEEDVLVYRLAKGFTVSGTVYDPDGNTLAGAWVCALDSRTSPDAVDIAVARAVKDLPNAVSDAHGGFSIPGLSPSESHMLLAVDQDGYIGWGEQEVRPGEDETAEVKCDIRIRGRGNVAVRFGGWTDSMRSFIVELYSRREGEEPNRPWVFWLSECPVEGKAVFRNLPSGTYRISAWPPGYLPVEGLADVSERSTATVDFQLVRGATASGVVVDQDGSAVGAAQVCALVKAGAGGASTFAMDQTAGPKGSFSFSGMPDAAFDLRVAAGGHFPALFKNMQPAGGLRLVVTRFPKFTGAFDMSMFAVQPAGLTAYFEGSNVDAAVRLNVGRDGSFSETIPLRVECMTPDRIMAFEARCTGRISDNRRPIAELGEFVIRAGRDVVMQKIRMIPAKNVTGLIAGPAGEAVRGAPLTFQSRGFRAEASSSADGSFAFNDVPCEDGTIIVEHPDFPMECAQVKASETGPVKIVLARGARIAGRVVDSAGKGVPCCNIHFCYTWEDPKYQRATGACPETDRNGEFRSGYAKPGLYRLAVVAGTTCKEIEVQVAAGELKVISITLP